MSDARPSHGARSGVASHRARGNRAKRQGARGILLLWLGCMVIGVGLIGWGLVSIRAQARPVSTAMFPGASLAPISYASNLGTAAAGASTTATAGGSQRVTASPRKIVYAKNPSNGEALGSLSIPALKQTMPIIQGTRDSDLKKGIGHYTKSVLPGQKDNCVISGHRDTFFAQLGKLKKGDRATAKTASGTYVYEVKRIRIVGKNDRTVIVPTDHGVLTLTTCYPFDYIGSAPKRYVVSADLVSSK